MTIAHEESPNGLKLVAFNDPTPKGFYGAIAEAVKQRLAEEIVTDYNAQLQSIAAQCHDIMSGLLRGLSAWASTEYFTHMTDRAVNFVLVTHDQRRGYFFRVNAGGASFIPMDHAEVYETIMRDESYCWTEAVQAVERTLRELNEQTNNVNRFLLLNWWMQQFVRTEAHKMTSEPVIDRLTRDQPGVQLYEAVHLLNSVDDALTFETAWAIAQLFMGGLLAQRRHLVANDGVITQRVVIQGAVLEVMDSKLRADGYLESFRKIG